ncbi:Activating signal cointegrator 1, variant 2 [Balamuthia mandrillaris]
MARYNPLPQQRYIQPAAQKDFELWTANRLKHLMGLEDVDALVQDLFAKETSQEVHEWVESVLGWERKAVKKFYENFVEKRVKTSAIFRLANDRSQARVVEQASTAEFEAYKKPELGEDGFMSLKAKAKAQKKQEEAQAQAQAQLQQQKAAVKQKKRNQRRNRRICDCQGLKCGVYMNCLWCGRVTCETEGPGPCFFCHHEVDVDNPTHVFSEERQDKKKKGSPQTTRAEEASTEMDEGLARALLRKDELLEYERNSARRTVVYDDHEDYFSVDSTKWLTAEEKKRMKEKEEEMKKKKEENARKITVSFDLAGRKVIHANGSFASVHSLLFSFLVLSSLLLKPLH